jgi:hypothetical protein
LILNIAMSPSNLDAPGYGNALDVLRRIVEEADRDPFIPVGHVIEHVVPQARAALAAALADEVCQFCGVRTFSPCDAPPADVCEQALMRNMTMAER